jgi:uncharacterized SAM-binding protein YcdF (DUF218 family)
MINLYLKRLCAGTLAAATLFTLICTIQVLAYAQKDETRPADAAIVLGAAAYGHRPSPIFRERINHAISLYQQGFVHTLIFTGGRNPNDPLSEAEVARNYALAQGVPAAAILIETTSTNTQENLRNAQEVAAAHNLHTFLIISTPYHQKRALSLADDLGLEAYSSPTRTTRWISWLSRGRNYLREVVAYMGYVVGL